MGNIPDDYNLSIRQRKFLEALTMVGTISGAARASGTTDRQHYRWIKDSEDYQQAFREARVRAADEILETCREVGIRDQNVSMLIHLSRGYFPEMFGTNRHEFSGPSGGPIEMTNKKTTDQLLERLRDLQQRFTTTASLGDTPICELPDNGVADSEGSEGEQRIEAMDT
tara:strand:- start:5987 stop:6493 length:507 start_codon:yes stop_codon:yes gene_type:complete